MTVITDSVSTPTALSARRHLNGSLDELLRGASRRVPMAAPADGLSSARFERVTVGGEPFVLKYLHVDDDWVARATGDVVCRPSLAWASGLLDALPGCLDHTIVGCVGGLGRHGWGSAVLMRDVTPWLVPEGQGPLPFAQHRRFLAHMAQLHAAFWGRSDEIGLAPLGNRYLFLTPMTARVEHARGGSDQVPPLIADGWERLRSLAPAAAAVVWGLLDDPSPLFDRLVDTPQTLVHGDWKAGNLGSHPDGRTILLDWAFPGRGPACADLAWYLAVNCDRLPEPKEAAIVAYRGALEACGIATEPWWSRQLEACLLGAFLQLGWSKTGGELAWWETRVVAAARSLT